MTTALVEQIRKHARDLLALADRMEGVAPATVAPQDKPDRMLNTAQAAKIARRSYSSLYRDAQRHGIGRRLPSGSWVFSQRALLAFLSGARDPGEVGETGDAA